MARITRLLVACLLGLGVLLLLVLPGLSRARSSVVRAQGSNGYDDSASPLRSSDRERLLLAFYYPWYQLSDWSSPQMLETPLFLYDSSDPLAMARHITWTQAVGLDGLIVSCWGSGAGGSSARARRVGVLAAQDERGRRDLAGASRWCGQTPRPGGR